MPNIRVPTAEEQPVMRLWPDAGKALALGRSATYEAAQRGEIPTLKIGARRIVPTAALRRMLQMDTNEYGNPDEAA